MPDSFGGGICDPEGLSVGNFFGPQRLDFDTWQRPLRRRERSANDPAAGMLVGAIITISKGPDETRAPESIGVMAGSLIGQKTTMDMVRGGLIGSIFIIAEQIILEIANKYFNGNR